MLDGLVDDLKCSRVFPSVVVVLCQVVEQPELRSRRFSRSCNFALVSYSFPKGNICEISVGN